VGRLGVRPGTEPGRDVARVIIALEHADVLPEAGDVYTSVPDPDDSNAVRRLAHARQVPRRNLWVWYHANGELELVPLTVVDRSASPG
jgi:hypothetical protein